MLTNSFSTYLDGEDSRQWEGENADKVAYCCDDELA